MKLNFLHPSVFDIKRDLSRWAWLETGTLCVRQGHRTYLSLIGKSIGADDAFVELHRRFGITGLVLVPEVHIIQAEALGVAFVPLKLVQQRPCGVAPDVDSIFDR